jgi:hypothetical protein
LEIRTPEAKMVALPIRSGTLNIIKRRNFDVGTHSLLSSFGSAYEFYIESDSPTSSIF